MEFKDYYATLGVPRDAAAADIKKAFRKLARKYHPDVSKEKDAEEKMKELNEANAVLSDPEKRAAYDQVGRGYRPGQEFRPPPDWDAGFEFSGDGRHGGDAGDFSGFFEELFGRAARSGRTGAHSGAHPGAHFGTGGGTGAAGGTHGRQFQARGQDHHAKVLLDIEDAWHGATQQISLRVPRLDDSGHVVLDTRTLNVRIPQGVRAGQLIRLAGQGAPGFGGGVAGDLLLEVGFRPHPRFRLDGRDVLMTLPVAPWECALGAMVPVTLPGGGDIEVRIAEGTLSTPGSTQGSILGGTPGGIQLRVRGKGLPGDPPGDLLLQLDVRVPPASSARARELYESMARELGFDARANQEVKP